MKKRLRRATALGIMALAMLVVLRACLSPVSEDSLHVRLAFDPDVYVDPVKDAQPVEAAVQRKQDSPESPPNIVIVLTDDLGYGDLGCYGSRSIRTPHIDALAEAGCRFTDFYAAAPICTPSRAGLLTGRYPHRTGVTFPFPSGEDTWLRTLVRGAGRFLGALGAVDMQGAKSLLLGLPDSEITLAEALKVADYQTACIGKWHLGDFVVEPRYHPRRHGFDYFMGINGANDDWPVGLWRNETELNPDIGLDQGPYTGMFTQEAIDFIERSKDGPFFLYLGHKDPHQPCIPSEAFRGRSHAGPFGDTVEEVDAGVGEIMGCLKRNGLDRNTLVFVTSDNGPWYNGSPGSLRGRKGQSFEGGYRVPLIAHWPGVVPPGRVCEAMTMGMDLFSTALSIAGLEVPDDRIIDGANIAGLLDGSESSSPHEALYFVHHNEVEGVRTPNWKYFRYVNSYVYPVPQDKPHTSVGRLAGGYQYQPEGSELSVSSLGSWPLLYDMDLDPGENYNLIEKYPEEGDRLLTLIESWELEIARNLRGWLGE